MIGPRWRKVVRDLWTNKARTILVVFSIAVGVFAVGLIACTQIVLSREMNAAYVATNPASATLYLSPFDDQLVQAVRRMPGVRDAAGHNNVDVRIQVGPDEWRDFVLAVVPDFSDLRINRIRRVSGAWPPRKRELLLERTSLDYLGLREGDRATIRTSDGKLHQLQVVGVVHDLNAGRSSMQGQGYGYITPDALALLDQGQQFDELRIVVADRPDDKDHIYAVTLNLGRRLAQSGYTFYGSSIPEPGEHWATETLDALLLILGVLGALSLLSSGFLVTNTVSALLLQQTRQIGVMKTIGARTRQIMGLYLVTVAAYSLLALLIAVPLGALGAWAFTTFNANLLNFDLASFTLPPAVLGIDIAVGLIVPLLATLWPILGRSRATVYEALSATGMNTERFGAHLVERLLGQVRGLSPPHLIALRNVARRRTRLALTLVTLTLSGAMMIAALSVRDSLLSTLDALYQIYRADIFVDMNAFYRVEQLQSQAAQVPGVVALEAWGGRAMRRVRPDQTESNDIDVKAPPANSRLFHPQIIAGRWLDPSDQNAVVIANTLLREEPDLKVGDDLVLRLDERQTRWRIVGIAQVLFAENRVYVNYEYFTRLVGPTNRSGYALVATAHHDDAFREQVARRLSAQFQRAGLRVESVRTVLEDRETDEERFTILVAFLLLMAILLAVVGGLGLAGMMSINVLERTREIGVMRAIGASTGTVLGLVILEGVCVGLLSWGVAVLAALPLSRLLSDVVGTTFLRLPLIYRFSWASVLIWLVLVVVLAAVASLLPARNAARLRVIDSLSYE